MTIFGQVGRRSSTISLVTSEFERHGIFGNIISVKNFERLWSKQLLEHNQGHFTRPMKQYREMHNDGSAADAGRKYVGEKYIQHNPLVGDGKAAIIEYSELMARDYPNKQIAFIRAVAQGDLVALHTHQTWLGDEEYVTMAKTAVHITLEATLLPVRTCQ